jgi:hypothetical protein
MTQRHLSEETPAKGRVALMILDVLQGLVLVAAITAAVVTVATPITPQPLLIILGIWTAGTSIWAMPALTVLHMSPPRVPLSQRSALFSSAKWFGRTVWAAAVFALSIVLGAVSGVVASRVSESERDLSDALGASLETTAQIALWPILAGVISIAYVVMSIRWLLDLGAIADSGGAHDVWQSLERRWFGHTSPSAARARLGPGLTWFAASVVGRVGLSLTLVTVGLVIAITWLVLASA